MATYTKPDLDLSDLYPSVTEAPMKVQPGDLEKSKREAIENQLNMLRRIYVQVGSKLITLILLYLKVPLGTSLNILNDWIIN